MLGVSNGVQSDALSALDIQVEPAVPTGTANLTWEKPANTNRLPLTNLAGFIIRYGMSVGALSSQIALRSAAATSAEIAHLTPGKWYFEVASINTANVEGPLSSIVGETIQ